MISRAETEQFAEDRARAEENANKGGRPLPIDESRAILLAGAVFMLLDVFAAITLPDRETAFWPIVILTGLVAGGPYVIARLQQRTWWKRYHQELDLIRADRERRARR